jgi:hypothetical protein
MTLKELEMESPYREEMAGILAFSTFEETERTLQTLENFRQKYLASGDKKGIEYCRKLALLGRRRAELIGRNKRVSQMKRLQKQEMADWFRIWLETPSLFDDWLSIRKNTDEFQLLQKSEEP